MDSDEIFTQFSTSFRGGGSTKIAQSLPAHTMQDRMKEQNITSPVSLYGAVQRSSDDSQVSAILADWMKRNGMEATKDMTNPSPEPRIRNSPVITRDPPLADVTIVTCDGGTIKAHKLILCLRSEVFSVMFMSHMIEPTANEVHVLDFPPHVVVVFIDYFYSNSIGDANLALCSDLYSMSRKYQANGLRQLCEERMLSLLAPSNVITILALGDLYNDKRLRHTALTYIAVSSAQLVSMPFFLEKTQQYMKNIQEPSPQWDVARSRSDSAVDLPISPVSPVSYQLRQLIQALAGVGPTGTPESLIFSPAGCTCHTCRVHRSTATTFHEHASLCVQRQSQGSPAGSPAASDISVPPQLFNSPLSFVESSLSNSADKMTPVVDKINSDDCKKDKSSYEEQKLDSPSASESHRDETMQGQSEVDNQPSAKRQRLEPNSA